ncbi:MAG: hypothetical protein KBD32_07400 [Burkholderiales bacterium]|nr:hypothetical protein [Burkholderiales bacterium]
MKKTKLASAKAAQKNKLKSKKTLKYVLGGVSIILVSSVSGAAYLFLNLDHYRSKINQLVLENTGYQLNYTRLTTGFDDFEPNLRVSNLSLTNPKTQQIFFKLKHINLTLSYSSLFYLQPIFSDIGLSGSSLNFEYDQHNNLLLNHEILTNLATPSTSTFDWENFLLHQKNISLANIDLILLDSKHKIRPLIIDKFYFNAQNSGSNQHHLNFNINFPRSHMEAKLDFNGSKLSQINDWSDGTLQINNIGTKGYLINLTAKIANGHLKSIDTKLDSNQQKINPYTIQVANISDFKGRISVKQLSSQLYQLEAPDLMVKTRYGYLFEHASISGELSIGAGGYLNISKLKLAGINNLLKISDISDKLTLSGTIDSVNLNWKGKILKPYDFNLATAFTDVSINSNESEVPSFNHLNGSINARESSGQIKLKLTNANLSYPKYIYQAYQINQFNSELNWQLESQNKVNLTWQNTNLQTPEVSLTSSGSYQQAESNLNATINLNYLQLNKLYKLLPTSVSKATLKDLQTNLKTGSLNNLQIKINGKPQNFPFKNESGSFSLNGELRNTNYNFMPKWLGLTNLNGNLAIKNQNLTLKLNSGNLDQLSLNNTLININDISQNHLTMTANIQINGSHEDYLDYFRQSPYEPQITTLEDQLTKLTGSAQTNIKLSLPLDKPQRLKLSGTYNLENSQLAFKSPALELSEIQGKLNFTQNGIETSRISAKTLNSIFEFNLLNQNELEISSPNFDYESAAALVEPQLTQVIRGHAPIKVNYNLKQQEVQFQSNLVGVQINAPEPLAKSESNEISNLAVKLNLAPDSHRTLNFKYANQLAAQASFDRDFQLTNLYLGLGANNLTPKINPREESSPITIQAYLEQTHLQEWVTFFKQLKPAESANNSESSVILSAEEQEQNESDTEFSAESETLAPHGLWPIHMTLNTNAFWLNNYNIVGGELKLQIDPDLINAQITTPDIEGTAEYLVEENKLNLDLQRLILSSKNFYIPAESRNAQNVESVNQYSESEIISVFNLVSSESNPLNESNLVTYPILASVNLALQESDPLNYEDEDSNENGDGYENESGLEISIEKPKEVFNLPTTSLKIRNLYLEDYYWGSLSGHIYQQDDSLYLENFMIRNHALMTRFNLTNHCMSCNESGEYVALNLHSDIYNFASLVVKLNQGDMFSKGSGSLDLSATWPGGLADFKRDQLNARVGLNINDGVLVHVNPGLFGALMGVINLSALNISNINHFNFNSFFGKSLAYKNLNANIHMQNDVVEIENLELLGDVAKINSFGNYYPESNTVDTYLTVEPRLGGTIATTAGIVTLNPIIGMFVYLGEKLIGDPINKALAISYHVQGNIESPTMTQTKISKQLMQNFKSSLDFLQPGND